MPHWKYWNVESRIGSSRSSTRTLNLRGLLNHADATAACLPSRTERNQAPKAKSKHDETTHASSSSQIELLIAKPMPAKCKAIFKIYQNMDSTNHYVIYIYHHNSSYIYMTSCSSKHMQHIAAWCMTSPNFFFGSAWCMTRKVVETCQNDSSFAPVTPVDSMPSLQAVKHNAINLRLLCLAKVGNTQWQ